MTEAAPESRLLAGEIAVVTGAAQGIGRGVAEVLAAAGATVAVADLDGAGARELASRLPGDCEGFAVDVRSEDAVAELEVSVRERLGIATLLVNNAGVQRTVPTSEMTTEDWDHVIDTNLAGTYRCCRVFGPPMLELGRGSIVNIASIAGVQIGGGGRVAYGASKAGVAGLTRVLGVEWASRGVRVNAIAPGVVITPLIERQVALGVLDVEALSARIPIGRTATPRDIGNVVLLLASPYASYIIGQTIVVDGGLTGSGPSPSHPTD